MGVDGGISSSSSQVLAISEGNVFSVAALVTFSKPEVNNVNRIFCVFSSANQKVIRFDISVNNSFLVNNFYSLDHLSGDVQNRL